MNKSKILAVADAIESHSIPDLGFNMADYVHTYINGKNDKSGHNCRTTACIGGWVVALDKSVKELEYLSASIFGIAQHILELDTDTAWDLMLEFRGSPTTAQAVSCLRHLAETGEVDWAKALAEV